MSIIPTINVMIERNIGDSFNIHPSSQRIHHRIQNPTILHKLNHICGINFFTNGLSSFSLFRLLEIASTNHQTIAMQLENHAISQIKAAKLNVISHCSVEKPELISQYFLII